MRIGVLGTGTVGQTLGRGLIGLGHEVMLGSRDARRPNAAEWAADAGELASTGTFADAAAFGELIVLATLWAGTENALTLAGHHRFAGKIVIDATNPLVFGDGVPSLALGTTDSGGEQVQRWLPDARVVKAFNIVGAPHMVHPALPGGPPDMFIAGDSDDAKVVVTGILTSFGWPTIDIGGIAGARVLEPLCILWVLYGARTGTWNHAFKLLR
jgi:8-hydroxy-5-deazaflavin:NADPH oxidoreductase